MRSILVVEDDPDLAALVKALLEREGHTVVLAGDGLDALRQARAHDDLALVLLDITLPRLDGVTVLRRLREESDVPVMMLTGHAAMEEKLRSLLLGADDYLIKPFDRRELVARVAALLRRAGTGASRASRSAAGIELDAGAHVARVGGRALDLTRREFALLEALVGNPGEVLTREVLLDVLDSHGDRDVFDRAVDAHVARLRKKLREAGRDVIVTVWGVGYRFEADPTPPA